MKFKRTYKDLREWHRWFAWFPVRTDNDTIVWLSVVERRYVYLGDMAWELEHRPLTPSTEESRNDRASDIASERTG